MKTAKDPLPAIEPVRISIVAKLGQVLHKLRTQSRSEGVFHVISSSKLVAHIVMEDPWFGVSKQVKSKDIADAKIVHRPAMARGMPAGFLTVVCDVALWTYGQTLQSKAKRITFSRLGFRFVRMPDLPLIMLNERQIALLSWLSAHAVDKARDFEEMKMYGKKDSQVLANDLQSLITCGCLSSQPGTQTTAWEALSDELSTNALVWLGRAARLSRM